MVAASTVARDISARLSQEAHRDLLMHELSHRVKNTLATVQSMMAQTRQSASTVDAFVESFGARLDALATAHNLLTRSDWLGADLRELLLTELAPYGNDEQPQWEIEGEPVQVAPNDVIALGMAFHELATNAAKYGALSAPPGRVEVNWTLEGAGNGAVLHFNWAEHGGPKVEKPRKRGFGSRLIEDGLAYEMDAEVNVDFAAEGLRCTIDVPIEPVEKNTEEQGQ